MDGTGESPVRQSKRRRNIHPEYAGLDVNGRPIPAKENDSERQEQKRLGESFSPVDEGVLESNNGDRRMNGNYPNHKTSSDISHKRLCKSELTSCPPVRQSTESDWSSWFYQTISENTKFNVLVVLVIISLVGLYWYSPVNSRKGVKNENMLGLFPKQTKELWGFVSHGMTDEGPFVLLLVHDGESDLANCLAYYVAKKVASTRTKKDAKPVIVDGTMKHSNLLISLKQYVDEQLPIVFQDVEQLSGDVAEKLHFILDVHGPWVPGGVYVLTLRVPNVSVHKTFDTVHTFLRNRWSGQIQDVELDPLITRICDYIYVVRKEKNPCK